MNEQVAFFLQVALILGAARVLGELARRLRQPPVLGELLAGILLGLSVLGRLLPDIHHQVFGAQAALDHVVSVSLVLLLLLTGLETDVRLLRHMGRAALATSAGGLAAPFVCGFALATLIKQPFDLPFAVFMGAALVFSALPVIAKILLDLNLLKRDVGLVILSGAVVNDTAGWVLLALVSGMVTGAPSGAASPWLTLFFLALFVAGAGLLLYPLLRWLLPRVEHVWHLPGGELVLILATCFLCAAATEAIHVHPIFGAFVAGLTFRQCPTLSPENVHRLEGITGAFFAPLFFGSLGLGVDFGNLHAVALPLAVIGAAFAGKISGCLFGGALGGLSAKESLAAGLGLSAGGAVTLIGARIGQQLGVVDAECFSVLVLLAVVTTLAAPLALKWLAPRLPVSEAEAQREKGVPTRFLPAGALKLLIPAGGGPNARVGCHLAAHLCTGDGDRCLLMNVETKRRPWRRRWRFWRRPPDLDAAAYLRCLERVAGAYAPRITWRRVPATGSVQETILAEAAKGYHFVMLGASGYGHPVHDPFLAELVQNSPTHLVIVAKGGSVADAALPFKRVLVPTNGSHVADAALEFAVRYAQTVQARVSVLYVAESHKNSPIMPAVPLLPASRHMQDLMRETLRRQYGERISPPALAEFRVRESESLLAGLLDEVAREGHDLVVLGAESRSLVDRLYLGTQIEAAIEELPCTLALVIPKALGRK